MHNFIKKATLLLLALCLFVGSSEAAFATTGTVKSSTTKVTVAKTKIVKVSSGIKKFTVKAKKVKGAKGYQFRYSLDENFKSKVKYKKTKNRSLTVKKAKEGIYYVQVRAYKIDSKGKKVYGKWSKSRNAKFVKYRSGLSNKKIEKILKGIKNKKNRKAVQYALSRIGHPYSQAKRNDGTHFDCGSFAYYCWKYAGVNISYKGRNMACYEYKKLKKKKVSLKKAQPGSLIFWSYGGGITHVAVYVGNGKIVDAANSRKGVVYRNIYHKGNIYAVVNPTK